MIHKGKKSVNWTLSKLKTFCSAINSFNTMKGEVTQWEKIFTNQMTKDIRIRAQKLTLKKSI